MHVYRLARHVLLFVVLRASGSKCDFENDIERSYHKWQGIRCTDSCYKLLSSFRLLLLLLLLVLLLLLSFIAWLLRVSSSCWCCGGEAAIVVAIIIVTFEESFLLVERLLATIKGMKCTMIRVSRYSFQSLQFLSGS